MITKFKHKCYSAFILRKVSAMKKHLLLIPIVFMLFSTACVGSDDSLASQVKELQARVSALEAMMKKSPFSTLNDLDRSFEGVKDKNESGLALGEVTYSHIPRSSSEYYLISYTLINNSDKGIKLVKALIVFEDLLGDLLYEISVDPDLSIPAGEIVKTEAYFSLGGGRYAIRDARMKTMEAENVVKTLKVKNVVYADNSVYGETD